MRTLVHNPALHPGRIDSNPRLQSIYREAILAAGGVSVQLGHGEILAIRLSGLFEVFERLLGQGVTIYDHPVPAEPPAAAAAGASPCLTPRPTASASWSASRWSSCRRCAWPTAPSATRSRHPASSRAAGRSATR